MTDEEITEAVAKEYGPPDHPRIYITGDINLSIQERAIFLKEAMLLVEEAATSYRYLPRRLT